MNTTFTRWMMPSLCKVLKLLSASFILFTISLNGFSQQASLLVNERTPWVDGTFAVTHDASSTGLSFWTNPGNVEDADLTNFAIGNILATGSVTMKVYDTSPGNIYSAGNFAGFRVQSSNFNVGILSGITIRTLLNGTPQETQSGFSLAGLSVAYAASVFDLGFITTLNYNEIEISFGSAIGIGAYRVYYAVMERYVAGPALTCNVQTDMNKPLYPMTIDYSQTGSGGITVGYVDAPEDAISASVTDYASLVNLASVAGSTFIAVHDQVTDYPSGTFVGFDLENFNLAGVNLLGNLTITSYLNGVQQQSVSGSNLIVNGTLLSSERQTIGFVTNTMVDEVKLTVSQTGSDLGTSRVYNAVFQCFQAGPPLVCNTPTTISTPLYPLYIDGEETGFTGAACVLCEIENQDFAIDADPDNAAEITITAGVAAIGSLAIKDQVTNYSAGTFAGFHIENPLLVGVDALTGITITTYLEGVQQQSMSGSGALISVGSDLLTNTGEQYVGFVTTTSFDEVKISLFNVGSLNLGTTLVYGLIVEDFCDPTVACNTNYFWTNPAFPAYIDAFRTGPDGLACVGCAVNNEQNVLTASNTDYATIQVVAGVAGTASLAVADALYTYPVGTYAGFVIEDVALLLEAELFQTLTISTYNNGVFQESESAGDLLDLALLILFISDEPGRYNVGFQATLPFDEIRITVGSLATAINLVRVYGAFVDTRASNGGALFCNDAPIAVNDNASTSEDVNVTISVLDNDTDSDNVVSSPQPVSNPTYGDITVNGNNTITYDPDPNFVGTDVFTYRICDAGPLCDTATVTITVNPVTDIIPQNLPEGGDFTACANTLTTYTAPATTLTLCGGPTHGDAVIMNGCITYTADAGYTGTDMVCVYSCHPTIPGLCDTTRFAISISAVNEAPVAEDDIVSTNQNVPVNIDVLANDSDTDSPLGIPQVLDTPDDGSLLFNPADSSFTYTPDPGFVGTDIFTYQICDDGMPPLCDMATVTILVLAVSDTVACNIKTPLTLNSFPVSEDHSSSGLACWEGDLLCTAGSDIPANVVNSNLGDFATGYITGLGQLNLSVTDNTNSYPGGYFAGFVISSGLFNTGVFNTITVRTYLDNVPKESKVVGNLAEFSAGFLSGNFEVGFVTTMTFDEVEIEFDNLVAVGSYNVHYAIIEKYCAGPALICNEETRMNKPTYPVTIDYDLTGSDGVTIGLVDNPEGAVSPSTTDYASLVSILSAVGSTFITVEEQVTNYPAGTFVGFDIENLTLVSAELLNYITITSYLNDVQQQQVSGPGLLMGVPMLSGSGRHTVGFVTNTAVDKVTIAIEQPVGVSLGTTRVYGAIFRSLCEGPALACNIPSALYSPPYPILVDVSHTGMSGAACVGCNVIEAGNVVDDNAATYGQIIITAGALGSGSISVKDQLTNYPANTLAGFRIENPALVDADALTGITITTYLEGVLQESQTNIGALLSVESNLLGNDDQQVVGFVTTLPFDEVQISLNNVGAVEVGTTKVYEMIAEHFCIAEIECDTTYYMNPPGFPVYIDAFLTGVDGVTCIGCSVENELNVITASNTDYGTIQIGVNVIGSASIAVADALFTYPQGTFAGFVIEDPAFILQAELFGTITISTYNDGNFVESRSGVDLIDLAVFVLFISADQGRYNVGFFATLPFDEIRITVGSLATAINVVRVYSAFTDTRSSEGGPGLSCLLLPVKWLSFEVTKEGSTSRLIWITSEESNNAGYEIERSKDGRVFTSIGKVSAQQSSQLINTYSSVDQNPLAGINYYRIRQVDHDGHFSYSQVKSLHFGDQPFSTRVWPNPARDEVTISMNTSSLSNASVQVVNHEGKIILQHLYEHLDDQTRIDIGTLPPGLYTVLIECATIFEIHKIVVVK